MNKTYTVIGYWNEDDNPIPVGVIQGDHVVHGGAGATEGGDWATSVTADSHDAAEKLAVKEMRGPLGGDGNEDSVAWIQINERVVWTDPDGGNRSVGRVAMIRGDITVAMDDGGQNEVLAEELSQYNEGDDQ